MRRRSISAKMFEVLYVAQILKQELGANPSRREISRRMDRTPVCIGKYVERLQSHGLVAKNSKYKGVALTEKGQAYLVTRVQSEKRGKVSDENALSEPVQDRGGSG